MAWFLSISREGKDLYPEIKRLIKNGKGSKSDKVRYEILDKFGYYVTESSEHNAEYMPYFMKEKYPDIIGKFNIPLDEYPRRCIDQLKNGKK